ncbi:hypothetical protein HaLaN_24076 [Haematococcus lacustris]|uniref:Uncharacterized protein n=1 Tax=Haematococcus lacustris TaxID=44745 RepID=A0A6A0A220_HAELA|nr:hypothetical protein HaLaN_24076 [Haematococcus lacustris]
MTAPSTAPPDPSAQAAAGAQAGLRVALACSLQLTPLLEQGRMGSQSMVVALRSLAALKLYSEQLCDQAVSAALARLQH